MGLIFKFGNYFREADLLSGGARRDGKGEGVVREGLVAVVYGRITLARNTVVDTNKEL
jgi:hypothetical protein